jgi:cbb3-type cytochrome oxidase maturation protein
MDSIFLLIPIAIIFSVMAVAAFFWAVNNKQYDDLDSEAEKILFDDPVVRKSERQSVPPPVPPSARESSAGVSDD